MNAESATPSSRASIAMNDSVGFRGQEMGRSKRQKTCDLINVLIKKKGDKYLSIDQGDFKIAERALSHSDWYELKVNEDNQICGLQIRIRNDHLAENLFKEFSKLSALQELSLKMSELRESTFKSVIRRPFIGLIQNLSQELHNDCYFEDIPEEIGNLVNLRSLTIAGYAVASLPSFIGNLKNLRYLRLQHN